MNIEIHLIQNFAPSCLNRDDTNTPKSCLFGGVRRARISSQCLKRTVRLHMRDAHQIPTGIRTRRLAAEIAKRLPGRDVTEATRRALVGLSSAGFSAESNDDQLRTNVGLYLSVDEIYSLAAAADADWDQLSPAEGSPDGEDGKPKPRGNKKEANSVDAPAVAAAFKQIQDRVSAADIALFGRMVAERAHMEVDAACQVAHALSTHEVEAEMDYFTAVDDLQPKAETGAGMLGIAEYNSACFYRYALINRSQPIRNLDGDAALADRAIRAFVESTIRAIPSARQNSSAAHNLPDYVQVVVGASTPQSLSNAFAAPVRTGRNGDGLVATSIDRLTGYQRDLERMYGAGSGERRIASTRNGVGDTPLPGLLEWLDSALGGA